MQEATETFFSVLRFADGMEQSPKAYECEIHRLFSHNFDSDRPAGLGACGEVEPKMQPTISPRLMLPTNVVANDCCTKDQLHTLQTRMERGALSQAACKRRMKTLALRFDSNGFHSNFGQEVLPVLSKVALAILRVVTRHWRRFSNWHRPLTIIRDDRCTNSQLDLIKSRQRAGLASVARHQRRLRTMATHFGVLGLHSHFCEVVLPTFSQEASLLRRQLGRAQFWAQACIQEAVHAAVENLSKEPLNRNHRRCRSSKFHVVVCPRLRRHNSCQHLQALGICGSTTGLSASLVMSILKFLGIACQTRWAICILRRRTLGLIAEQEMMPMLRHQVRKANLETLICRLCC